LEDVREPVGTPAFWQALYDEGRDGWELGGPAPALAAWLDDGGVFPSAESGAPARVAVPGAGRGHDARLIARRGYRVWGFDWAPSAISEARRLAAADGAHVAFESRDVFTLAERYPGAFDGVWEYTCYCAIDPGRRDEYARVLHAILRPGGLLVACFYPLREGTGGPPFPVARAEIDARLAGGFRIRAAAAPPGSPDQRRGLEWLVIAERL
jgi:SAM-dependent methyltransferase